MRCAIVIPARMGSTRFPGKPLVVLSGKAMVHWVVEAAEASGVGEKVVVATPDDEILEYCRAHRLEAIRTRVDHPSGTDRLAEVAESMPAEVYVNVQGDEPLIRPDTIQACAEPLLRNSDIGMGSVYSPCNDEELENPAVVKVVIGVDGYALYFSRYPIPFPRNARAIEPRKHVGIYAYRRDVLQAFSEWPVTPLEATESLEQLRFLERGVRIFMSQGQGSEMAVDTPEQAVEVSKILDARKRMADR